MTTGTSRPGEALVLAAGRAMRLRPLTRDRPKCLVDVGGQSVLARLIGQLEAVGIERVVVVTGHCRELVEDALSSWPTSTEVEYVFNPEFKTTNNAVSLAVGLEQLRSDQFLLCDGDVVLRSQAILDRLLAAPGDGVVGYRRLKTPKREAMKVTIRGGNGGRIEGLGKSLPPAGCHGEALGLQKIGPRFVTSLAQRLASLDESRRRNWYYEDVFALMIRDGAEFRACELPGEQWTEIDTPADLERARRLIARW